MRSRSHDCAWRPPMKDDSLCIRRYLAAHLKDV
jgi:hypothetical protein